MPDRLAEIRIPLGVVLWVIWFTALGVWQASLGRWGWVVVDAVMVTAYLAFAIGKEVK